MSGELYKITDFFFINLMLIFCSTCSQFLTFATCIKFHEVVFIIHLNPEIDAFALINQLNIVILIK